MKTELLFLLPVGLLAGCSNGEEQNKIEGQKPNVILIYADDIGLGDLSCYGYGVVKTPNVDKLAQQGIRFTNAHCVASTSTPSRYSMLTGEYAWRKAGTGIATGDAAMIITPERYTLADMFSEAGYNTAAVGKWHLGLGDKTGAQNWNEIVKPNPSDIGFEYSYIMAATGDRTPCIYIENGLAVGLEKDDPIEVSYTKNFEGEPTGKENPEMLILHPSHGHDQALINGVSRIGFMKGGKKAQWKDADIADSIAAHAVEFIEAQEGSDKPFFLYLATNDIHVPRVPHARFAGKSGLGARGDALLSFDWTVGEVTKTLQRLGMEENTMIIISSDNGAVLDDGYADMAEELIGEHKASANLRGGKYSSFEGGTRVPFIVQWEGTVAPGVSDELVSQIDFIASMGALVGQEVPQGAAPDSENHLDSWVEAQNVGREHVIAQSQNLNVTIRNKEWKYIPPSGGAAYNKWVNIELGNNPEPQLYNLIADPSEQNNVAADNKEVMAQLAKTLEVIKSKKE